MKDRYFVKYGSDSGHCCFEASVMDSQEYEELHGITHYNCVCECFEEKTAQVICET